MPNDPLIMRVRAALAAVKNPASGRSIIADGLVQGLSASPAGVVRFTLESASPELSRAATKAAEAVEGAERVVVVATAHKGAQEAAGGHSNPMGLQKKQRIEDAGDALSGVRNIIAVASGKGGVGKSTVAANLAVALAKRGLKVGLMDADIYGPSLPILFGLTKRPETRDGKLIPAEAFGVKAMSIGLLVEPERALAWRGPMVMGAIRQLMSDVDWGTLDVLVIDTPPGTGDAHLTLAQSKKLTGAVIVSTPQELALADVRRGIELFRKVDTPILGVVENMAWLEGANGARTYLFGEGGAERAAKELGAPFLGALPIYPDLREASDAGTPIVASAPDSPAAKAFTSLAERVASTFTA
ncbi:MAG TPA: Mrp/NBP35 family ATP-binding protein [Parvularculaceae bacterium]|nr:Mrp/NBP35 family ATP-binding protein [Caulobacterales bacterium]HPE30358.1 Mrp/NBP35 family ATP-binding protein [Parvularculaceae bacterium]